MKKLLPILFLLMGIFSLSAQIEVRVEGFVKNDTGIPLMGVDLDIIATACDGNITYQNTKATTNVDGYYSFNLVACQQVYVSVSMLCSNETLYQSGVLETGSNLFSLDFVCNDQPNPDSCFVEIEVEHIDDYALLTAYPNGSSLYSYYWSDNSLENITQVSTAGEYCVTIVDPTGCQAVGCVYVEFGDTTNYCDVDFRYGADSIQSESGGFIYWFQAEMINASTQDYTYAWDFSDNQSESGRELTHYFEKAGTYNICLIATNPAGVRCRICKDIEVKDNHQDGCSVDIEIEYINDYALLTAHPNGNSSPYSYYWSDSSLEKITEVGTQGEYCVTVVDATGCQVVECVYVQLGDTSNCEVDFAYRPDSIQSESGGYIYLFDAHPLNTTNEDYTYSWIFSGIQSDTGRSIVYYFEKAGTYQVCVIATNRAGETCEICKEVYVEEIERCVDYNNIDSSVECDTIYAPVCGCNGVTYRNECEAANYNGVANWTQGECGSGCQIAFAYHPDTLGNTTGAWLIYFDAWTLDGNSSLYTYKWDFGNGQKAEGQYVSQSYTSGGKYYVCVEAWDGDKFICSWCQEIFVGDDDFCIDPSKIDDNAICETIHAPVCGCDGVTYENECVAKAHGVVEWRNGACDQNEACEIGFTYGPDSIQSEAGGYLYWFEAIALEGINDDYSFEWSFGDGQTGTGRHPIHYYSTDGTYHVCIKATNAAGVSCEWCEEIRIQEDVCNPNAVRDPNFVCPEVYAPVCGCNNITYTNSCEARAHGVEIIYDGECDNKEDCRLAFAYHPDSVANTTGAWSIYFEAWTLDGNSSHYTYKWEFGDGQGAEGQYLNHSYTSDGKYYVCVEVWDDNKFVCSWCQEIFVGEEECIPYTERDPFVVCPEIYEPVCACNNITYANECEARAHGVAVSYRGECDNNEGCQLAFAYHPDSTSTTIGASLIHFDAWTLDGNTNAYRYKWEFGDGLGAEGQAVSHSYTAAGTYIVCVEAWDGDKFVCYWCEEVYVGKEDCNPRERDPNANCPEIYEPVCGCNNITYANKCEADAYGVEVLYEGECDKEEGCRLAFAYHPDSVRTTTGAYLIHFDAWTLDGNSSTYRYKWDFGDGNKAGGQLVSHNYTAAGKYVVCVEAWDGDRFVCSWCLDIYVGEDLCVDQNNINTTVDCKDDDAPVCGCDGITYRNACEAENYFGVTRWKDGPCDNDDACRLEFVYHRDASGTSSTERLIYFEAKISDASSSIYIYKWDFGDGTGGEGREVRHNFNGAGVYKVCVEVFDENGFACIWCDDIYFEGDGCIDVDKIDNTTACETEYKPVCGCDGLTYNNACEAENYYGLSDWREGPCGDNTNRECEISFEYFLDSFDITTGIWTYKFEARIDNVDPNGYKYLWEFENGTDQGQFIKQEFTAPGEYKVCLNAVSATGEECSICLPIYIGEIPEYLDCNIAIKAEMESESYGAKFSVDLKEGEPDFYYWVFDDGSVSTEENPYHDFGAAGNHLVCVEVSDSLGRNCGWCELFFFGDIEEYEDECLNQNQIDLDVNCDQGYEPVCGCDGITYYNECMAKNYYGIKEWKDGACEVNVDTIPDCDLSFEYNMYTDNEGKYLVEFFAEDALLANYRWDFGDGTTSEDEKPIHHFENLTNEEVAFTVCMYVLAYTDTNEDNYCLSEYCETIIFEPNPDNSVAGGVFADDENFTERRGVTRRNGSAGEPLADVGVNLLNSKGEVVATDVTDAQGLYHFDDLLFGNYKIQLLVAGITHDPFELKLDPTNQEVADLDFEVSDEAVTTSAKDLSFANNIKLYPNPTDKDIFVELNLVEALPLTIKIHNLFGQQIQVKEQDFNKGKQKMKFSLENAVPGVYLITIQSAKETFSRKIILQ